MPQKDAVPQPNRRLPSFLAGLSSVASLLFATSPPKPDEQPPAAPDPPHARPSSSSSSSRPRSTTLPSQPVFVVESDDEDSTRTAPRRVAAAADQPTMPDRFPPHAGAPAAASSKGKQHHTWGGSGWDVPVATQAPSGAGRGRQEASSSSAWQAESSRHGRTAYDVDLSHGVAVADQAQAYQRHHPGSGRSVDDEIQITHATQGSSTPRPQQPYFSNASGYPSSSNQGLPPPTFGNPGPPSVRHALGEPVLIPTPREQRVGNGPPESFRFGTNGGRDHPYGNAPPAPLNGAKAAPQPYHSSALSVGSRALLEADRRAQLDQSREEARAKEKEKRHAEARPKKKAGSLFNLGQNTLDSSPASSSSTRLPPPGQVAGPSSSTRASPYFPPSSNRNGGDRPAQHPVASESRGPLAQTPTQPARRNEPAGDSRAFAAGGDAALVNSTRNHANLEALPRAPGSSSKAPTLSFKKKNPPVATPAAPRAEIARLNQRRTADVIDVLSDDDEPQVPLSQQTEDIGTFDDEQAPPPSARKPPPAQPAATKGGGVKSLLDDRPPPNLNPLPLVKGLKPRPAPPPDDDEPIPINMPKEGSMKPRSIVGKMAPKSKSHNSSVPTSLTRNQVRQLSGGMVLQLPGATIAVPGPVRACKVFVNAETLSIATIGHDTIADLPLFHVKELQYSNEHVDLYLMRILLDPANLPPALEKYQETILVWRFPVQEAKKLETDFDKIPELQQLREVRRLNGEERKKLQLTRMSKPATEKLIRRVENLGKKPAPARPAPAASAIKTRAAVDLGPISIDGSDDELDFPDLKPPPAASVPKSAVARGKQRETQAATKNEPPREPPPANPNELMCTWPSTGRPEISILRGDYHRTTHKDEYLNDTLIDWGLKRSLAHERQSNPSLDDDIYIFSSFLYFKLTEPHVLKAKKDPWENVRSWTTKKVEGKKEKELKIDLFKKKYIIVPINESYHWYLAIIVNPGAVLQPPPPKSSPAKKPPAASQAKTTRRAVSSLAEPMDVDAEDETRSRTSLSNIDSELLVVKTRESPPPKDASNEGAGPSRAAGVPEAPPTLDDDDENAAPDRQHGYVFILDSLGNATVKPAAVLSKYLRSEGIAHQGWDADAEATTLTADKVDVPRQGDESSCGVYLLHYAEVFMRDPDGTVDFMLHKRKPKRSTGSSIPWKEAHDKYVEERDAFWDKPQLADKRAGYRQALLDLEKEHLAKLELAKVEGREPSTGSKSPASSPVAADDAGAANAPARPAASAPASRQPSPATEAAAPPESVSRDDAPADAFTQPEPAAGTSAALDRYAAEGSPILPPSPPAEDALSPVRSVPPQDLGAPAPGEPDAMDMAPLRSSLPRWSPDDGSAPGSADEVASHVSASPDKPRSPPPQPQLQWATAAASPPPPTAAVKALAVVGPRSSEAEVALQTQATPRSTPSLEEIAQVAVIARAPTPQVIDDSDDDVVVDAGPSRQVPRKKRRLLQSPPAPVPSGQYFDPGQSHADGSSSGDDMNLFSSDHDRHERKRTAASPAGDARAGKRRRASPPVASAPPSQPAARFGPTKVPPSPKIKGRKPASSVQSGSSAPGGRKPQPRYQVHTGVSDDEDDAARGSSRALPAVPRERKLKQAASRAPGAQKANDVVVIDGENSDDNSDDSSLHGAGQPSVRKASVDV